MVFTVLYVACACFFWTIEAQMQENRPDLGQYQDFASCPDYYGPWYHLYRNYETDPELGPNVKCYSTRQVEPIVNGRTAFNTTYIKDGVRNYMFLPSELRSTTGYTVANVLYMTPPCFAPTTRIAVYIECGACMLLRTEDRDGYGCHFFVTDPYNLDRGCAYAYDSKCGPEKYTYYDPNECAP
ncbi:uncharacterized protein LOC135367584 [Ornithodoros turicata]|uniref:uncharacterized protein LOC135367584 n=1 Tax=Ornithodoros turicata TaxID=34597 RepID=UPI0031393F49